MNRDFRSWILIALLVLPSLALAQKEFRHLKVTHWDSRTGLPNDISLNIYQSREGFIWLTGYSGLIRFDGIDFTAFNSQTDTSFKSDGITSIIYQTEDSALWIGTPGSGLIRFRNGQTSRFIPHLNNITLLGITRNNELLIGTNAAIRIFTLFNYKTFTHKSLSRAQSDSAAAIWRKNNSVNWLNPLAGLRVMFDHPLRLDNEEVSIRYDSTMLINSYCRDSKKRIWVGSDVGIFQLVDGKAVVPKGLEGEVIIPAGFNRSLIIEDNEGGIWAGTRNGLAYMPKGSDRFTFYDGSGTVKPNNIQGMLKDSEGNIWVAADKGLYKFSPSRVLNFTEDDGMLNGRVNSITEVEPGKFLIVTRDNLIYNFDGQRINKVSKDTQNLILSPKEIYYLYTDKNKTVWAGANGLLYRLGKNTRSWNTGRQVRYVTEGLDGRVYAVMSSAGLARINDKDELEMVAFRDMDFNGNFLSTARQRRNGEWVLTSYSAGVMVGRENETMRKFPAIRGVKGIQVFSSYEDADNNLWFSTAKGLALLRPGKDSLDVIDGADGMPFLSCFEVLEDKSGYFWLPTNVGVMKASKKEVLDRINDRSRTIKWTMLDEGDGIVNQQFVGARHPIIGSDQKMYFPNISGLVVINPGEILTNPVKPKLAINGILVDDKFFPADDGLTIPPGDHRLVISYSALSFLAPEKTQIKFRLVGYDPDWITSRGDRRAIYTNLPPGEHVFEMIAANNDGVWADAPVTFRFVVEPRFYQTGWFKLLAALALLGLVWLIIRWKTSATRQRNQELEREVSKRTEQITRQKQELEETVTTLKATQKQLIQQEKMASLGELTAGIAHEIQNPLNFINNFSELNKELIDELKATTDPAEQEQVLGDITSNLDKVLFHGKRADSIVKSMLQHSHSKTGEKEPTDINALADEYLRLSFHGLRAKDKSFQSDFIMKADPSIGKVNIVRQDIGRVLLNIINNAFYAVNEKAKASGADYEPRVVLSTKKEGSTVQVVIEDNGQGIPENIAQKIFQPFFTTKPTGEGTGLGLSMSYDIIHAQGGNIEVFSKEGEGTKFVVSLPA